VRRGFKPRPAALAAGVTVEERPLGIAEQTVTHRARSAESIGFSVVLPISCAFTLCAWGRGQAESPAFRAPLRQQGPE